MGETAGQMVRFQPLRANISNSSRTPHQGFGTGLDCPVCRCARAHGPQCVAGGLQDELTFCPEVVAAYAEELSARSASQREAFGFRSSCVSYTSLCSGCAWAAQGAPGACRSWLLIAVIVTIGG